MSFICSRFCEIPEEREVLAQFLDFTLICYPVFDLSKDMKTQSTEMGYFSIAQIIALLQESLTACNSHATEKIVLRFSGHVIRHWVVLFHSISCPGRNVILLGRTGSGRYSLTRLVAHMCESDFIHIDTATAEELISSGDRQTTIASVIHHIVSNAAIQQKKSIVFIRATKHNREEAEMMLNFASDRDFAPFFTKGGLDELHNRLSSGHSSNLDQRLVNIRQVRQAIRSFIHVVIALEDDAGYTFERPGFDTIVFDSDSPGIYSALATEVLESQENHTILANATKYLLRVFPQCAAIARQCVPKFHPNMYYDFIDCFRHFAASSFQDAVNRNENTNASLEFLAKLESESRIIDRRLDSLAPTLQRLQMDSESLNQSYSTRKEAIETRRTKLIEEHKTRVAEVDVLEQGIVLLEDHRELIEPRLAQALEDVHKLTSNDIETIRITAENPTPAM
jgi:hypothetical protein